MESQVYDWDERDDVHAPVHLVGNQDGASRRLGANYGTLPGRLGSVTWYGNVPDHRRCANCFGRPMPKLPENLSEAQLDGRACIRCGAEHESKRPVEAWSRLSSQLFECVDTEACAKRIEADG
jgi:hypothetical protein